MTKKKHIETFGHTKFFNLRTNLPQSIHRMGKLNNGYNLSHDPKVAQEVYDLGFYKESIYKPCPFCEGEAGYYVAGYDLPGVHCYSCGVGATGSDSFDRWQQRNN